MPQLFLLNKGQITLSPGQKVLKAADYAVYVEAAAIIAKAREEAAAIAQKAAADYEIERQRGYAEGMTEGKMEIAGRMLDTVASSVDYLAGLEKTVVDLVMHSIHKVIEGFDDTERVLGTVRKALGYARSQKRVTLRICPEDGDIVQAYLLDLQREFPAIGILDIVPDSRLAAGACILESELGLIDASLEVQLAAIHKAFQRQLQQNAGEK